MGVSANTGVGRAAHEDKNAACLSVCACVVRLDGIFVHVDGRVSGLMAGHICVLCAVCIQMHGCVLFCLCVHS